MTTLLEQGRRAAQLLGAAASLREALGAPGQSGERGASGYAESRRQDLMGEGSLALAWEQGRMMTLEEAITFGLEESGPG